MLYSHQFKLASQPAFTLAYYVATTSHRDDYKYPVSWRRIESIIYWFQPEHIKHPKHRKNTCSIYCVFGFF